MVEQIATDLGLRRIEIGVMINKDELWRLKPLITKEGLVYLALEIDRREHIPPAVWTTETVLALLDRFRSGTGEWLFELSTFWEAMQKLEKKGFISVRRQLEIEWV